MNSNFLQYKTLTGIFMIGASTLSLELTLTRIFSVSMYHHFAFLAISVALLGIGASGIFLHIFAARFTAEKISGHLGWGCLFFAISTGAGFIIQLQLPFIPAFTLKALFIMSTRFLLLVFPFFFSGLCLALAFKFFPHNAGKLYFSNLTGSGTGCLITILILSFFGGSSSVIFISLLGCATAMLFFTQDKSEKKGLYLSFLALLIFISLIIINSAYGIFPVRSASKEDSSRIVYEDWNSFSRVAVYEFESKGLLSSTSRRYPGDIPKWKYIEIDSIAGTHLVNFNDENSKDLRYLKYDVTFAGFHLAKKGGDVLIIGPGGGRDVIASILFGHKEITGVEVNPMMTDIVNNRYADFSGKLYSRPDVNIIVDEARSYLSRTDKKFDIIQASLACTWSSNAAGAFVLTENNLYTKEAFSSYLSHLKEDGTLSMTMWFRGAPGEMLRLVNLGVSVLEEMNVKAPQEHIAVVMYEKGENGKSSRSYGYGTFLLKKSPFTPEETGKLYAFCKKTDFKLSYAPYFSVNSVFSEFLNSRDRESFIKSFPLDISAPADDKPFFFYLLRFRDFWKTMAGDKTEREAIRGNEMLFSVVFILVGMFLIATALSLLFMIAPLLIDKRNNSQMVKDNLSFILFFAFIGLAFMLVEMPLLQRFVFFLGKPIYSLSVVLFSLLLFSGIGSYISNSFNIEDCKKMLRRITLLLALTLTFYAFYVPAFLNNFLHLASEGRIIISVLLLVPLGLLMGIPFPLGIRLIAQKEDDIIAWAWAINGAASVTASVLAIILAINFGLTLTLIIGQVCYLLSFALTKHFA